MSGKFGIFQTRKATKETPFDETFGITRRAHVMYMISGLTYLLVAWLLQQNAVIHDFREGSANGTAMVAS